MIGDSITYPLESSPKNLVIGTALMLLSILLVPIVFVMGYYVKVYERTFDGIVDPPEFSDESWGDLFNDGLVYAAISIIYVLLPLLLVVGGVAFGAFTGDPDALSGAAIATILLAIVAYLGVAYVLPAAIMNYVYHDRFGAAFDFGDLLDVTLTGSYFIATLVIFALSLGIGIITSIISIIPVLGWIASVAISFYFGIVCARIYANAYVDIREEEAANPLTDEGGRAGDW